MCVKLKTAEGEIDEDEWSFFLRGGTILDRSGYPAKPQLDWITQMAWDNLNDLERTLPEVFTGVASAISGNFKEWNRWFMSARPEEAPLPGEWETKCEDYLKKMIVLRCLRPDRVVFASTNFVEQKMKKEFIETKPTTLSEVYKDSRPNTPIIFVLSPGVDPTDLLMNFAEKEGQKVETISLGRG
jgi:dynein heavy chain